MSTKSQLPTRSELLATVDQTGVVNLTKLTDLCIATLHRIEGNAFGSGNKARSQNALSKRVRELLEAHSFAKTIARQFFWDHPFAMFTLERESTNE